MSRSRKLLLVAVLVLAAGCSSSPAAPKSFTLSGTVTLARGATDAADGVGCTGWAGMGFGAVKQGATVTVFGKDGAKLAQGQLGPGRAPSGFAVPCRFTVRVPGVRAGQGPYRVKIADRAAVTVPEAQVGKFAAPLG